MNLGIDPSLAQGLQALSPQTMPKPASRQIADSLAQPAFRDALTQSVQAPGRSISDASPAKMAGDFIRSVNAKEQVASATRGAFLAGEPVSLHQTMIASQEASVSFSLMVEMRNKVMEAYQELMRIQI